MRENDACYCWKLKVRIMNCTNEEIDRQLGINCSNFDLFGGFLGVSADPAFNRLSFEDVCSRWSIISDMRSIGCGCILNRPTTFAFLWGRELFFLQVKRVNN